MNDSVSIANEGSADLTPSALALSVRPSTVSSTAIAPT